jgi:Flp pilus assembly pilin Flp
MRSTIARILALMEREDGQTMAEYAVVLSVIAITVVTALVVLSTSISGVFDTLTPLI